MEMSRKTLESWLRDGWVERTKGGRVSTLRVQRECERRHAEAEEAEIERTEGGRGSPALERLREVRVKRELMRLDRERGKLVLRAEVEAGWLARQRLIKRSLQAIPKEMKRRLAGKKPAEIERLLADRIVKAFNIIAEG